MDLTSSSTPQSSASAASGSKPGKVDKREQQIQKMKRFREEINKLSEEERHYENSRRNLETRKAELAQPRWCSTCWILKQNCVCAVTEAANLSLNHNIWFYMHSKEYGRVTNTAIAMLRGCPNSTMSFIDGVKTDEVELMALVEKNPFDTFILTPSHKSVTYTEFLELREAKMRSARLPQERLDAAPHINIIAIDSTWSQAKRLVKVFPTWVPHVRLADINKTISPLRTQSSEGRVTTAEAIVILLKEMGEEKEKTDAIFNLLQLRIDAVTAINGWKGTGRPKRDTGNKYPPLHKNSVYGLENKGSPLKEGGNEGASDSEGSTDKANKD